MKRIIIAAITAVIIVPGIMKVHTICKADGERNADRIVAECRANAEAEFKAEQAVRGVIR